MKFICLVLVTVLVSMANAQETKHATLPNVEDVVEVTDWGYPTKFFTPESLLKRLPEFILSEDTKRTPQGKYQKGDFRLKDGTIIYWAAEDNKSIFLTNGYERKLFIIPTAAQIDKYLALPKAEDIEEISISSSVGNWFTADSLLKVLPKFVAGGSYKTKMLWQYGTIRLKNGKVLNWKSDSDRTLVLYIHGGEKYFQLPDEIEIVESLILPNPDEVERIEISNTSAINWYKPAELLRFLPDFVAAEGTYLSKQPFQYGTFVLKNGKKIKWMAGGKDTILLYDGSREQLFKIPRLEIE